MGIETHMRKDPQGNGFQGWSALKGLKKWPGKLLPGKTPREMASRNDPQGMACQNAADLERRVAVRRTCPGTWFLLFSPRDQKAPGLKENCDGLVSNPRFSHERISFKVYWVFELVHLYRGLVWAIKTIVAQVWPYWSPGAHPSLAHSRKWRQERKYDVIRVRVVRNSGFVPRKKFEIFPVGI
jgi:hypothetical protein